MTITGPVGDRIRSSRLEVKSYSTTDFEETLERARDVFKAMKEDSAPTETEPQTLDLFDL